MTSNTEQIRNRIQRCVNATAVHNLYARPYFEDRQRNGDAIAVLTVRTIEHYKGDPEMVASCLHAYAANLNAIASAHLDLMFGPQAHA